MTMNWMGKEFSVVLAALMTVAAHGQPRHLTYVVLGDSTAAGVGAPYEEGIARSTERQLARTYDVTMTNVAVSGARCADVVRVQLPKAEALKPDLVLVSIGANDVTHLTFTRSMRRAIETVVARLRVANPHVAIAITGSPDMGAPPRVPRLLRPITACKTRRVNAMFESVAHTSKVAFARIAATTGPLFRNDRTLFAADRFHPNARGYATWLPELNRALAAALAEAP